MPTNSRKMPTNGRPPGKNINSPIKALVAPMAKDMQLNHSLIDLHGRSTHHQADIVFISLVDSVIVFISFLRVCVSVCFVNVNFYSLIYVHKL
jgi:hypothetical protein